MKALAYLFLWRTGNAIRQGFKQPRLMIPALLLLLVLGGQVWSGYMYTTQPQAPEGVTGLFTRTDLLIGGPGAFLLAVRGILLLSFFSSCSAALSEGTLFFTQSDIDFLFPAPLSRRAILFTRMLGRYIGLLLPAVYLPLILGGASLAGTARVSPLELIPGFIGAWLYLATITNVAQAVLLSRSKAGDWESATAEKRRQALQRIVSALILLLLLGGGYLGIRYMLGDGIVDVGLLAGVIHAEAWNRILLPDAWAAYLFEVAFTGWELQHILQMSGLILLCVGSFVWLYARDRDFFESALDVSARVTQMTNAVRGGNAGAIISQMAAEGKLARGHSLKAFGGGAWAIFWKDSIALTRAPWRSWLQLLFMATLPALIGGVLGRKGDLNILVWLVLFTMQMAGLFLLSLRDMLRRVDISKSLPIAPWKFLVAELALSVVQLTVLGWFSLTVMICAGMGRGPLIGLAAVILPTLVALLLIVQTAFVLLYPNPIDPAQQFVGGILSMFASLFAVFPAIVLGVSLYLITQNWLLVGGSILVSNILGAGIWLAISTVLWKRFDPTD
jgi:hypothetical protein